ncbi:glycosyltransferase family 2 protein [Flavivirga aquimarina]|uniref:Glycosyltransferase family 2 protein n=1 Tax=Flavivirga aquimarina TaxID=2027862 RepID=A0ABT8WCL5_9FLAO|nr:glycosyltransferase family 2 protein [Flavivirga aquimarina]MDO5970766.1 glycosyltransferase family 2 protein [Flavivirga aquimarina]
MNKKLSIIIPAFNEENTVLLILNSIQNVTLIENVEKEIVLVDDCSTDNTLKLVNNFKSENPEFALEIICHKKNQGKGAAIHTGIAKANGDFIIIQDADLEYDPNEYNTLLKPILAGFSDAVYGSRFIGGNPHRVLFFFHTIGNKFLTFLSNLFTGINITDMETCYKLFKSEFIKPISLKEKRFGFEPEVTAKISKIKNIRIYEVGISYYGRTYDEGKKIGWKDGFHAIYCILRYNIFK